MDVWRLVDTGRPFCGQAAEWRRGQCVELAVMYGCALALIGLEDRNVMFENQTYVFDGSIMTTALSVTALAGAGALRSAQLIGHHGSYAVIVRIGAAEMP
jgi:hypothetical protein